MGERTRAGWVMAFSRGRLVLVVPTTRRRADVARIHGRALEPSGFTLAGTLASDELGPDGLEVFAIGLDRASELELARPATETIDEAPAR